MKRQLSGLPMAQQLAFAEEYRGRFGAKVHLGATAADPVTVSGVPATCVLDHKTRQALRELDERVYLARCSVCSGEP